MDTRKIMKGAHQHNINAYGVVNPESPIPHLGSEFIRMISRYNSNIGGFSGHVSSGNSYLVARTDGVGTKLKVAMSMNKHETIGIDLVAVNANNVVTSGAQPIFFLDYFATSKLDLAVGERVIRGINEGCRMAGCGLIGGETSEVPEFHNKGDYDIAGFMVGSVVKDRMITGDKLRKGNMLLGFPSSGLHTNGFSLARSILHINNLTVHDEAPWKANVTIGQEMLEPTRMYVKEVLDLHDKVGLKGVAHITGGGLPRNIPRMIGMNQNKKMGVLIDKSVLRPPPIMEWLQQAGKLDDDTMRSVYNMGIGMVVAVSHNDVDTALALYPELMVVGEVFYIPGVTFV
jgi:phosphoribosylformylglycinamidine cyclo-ligase